MRVLDRRTYVGPNLYANFQVIRMTLDLGPLETAPSAEIPGFVDALLEKIPSLNEHGCSYGEPGGFVRRLRDDRGTWMGHVMEHVAIELQNLAGSKVTFGKTRGTGELGRYHMVYEYESDWVGEQAGDLALRLIHSLIPAKLRGDAEEEPDFNFQTELSYLIRGAQRRAFGPSTASLVRAAQARDIPWIRLNNQSLVQFGHGKLQKRIQATVTSETRHIAVEIASDKEQTNKILGDIGLPVPKQIETSDADGAVRAARRIGYPVVVKPLDANHGRGVSIGLTTEEQVITAFHGAAVHSSSVLVESYIQGFDHRMLVVNGELVAVSKRVPGHVVGDGRHTVAELVELVNQDPRRGIGHEKVLTRLELDDQANRLLGAGGITPDTVLEANQVFYLRSTGNLSTGGTAIDMTDVVHPDNAEMAVRAAQAVGLDVCGVDFLTPDITRSYHEVGGGICELNAAPGFRMHVAPSEGKPRDVAGKVLDMLFPRGAPTRIPIAAVTGTNGKTTTTRMLAHIHKMAGGIVGMTTTDGVYIDGMKTVAGDMTGPVSARMVLRDPKVDVAILETARGGLLRAGLGYGRPDVAAVLNVSSDHLGMGGVHTLEQLADVKRIPVEVCRGTVVLNADDPLVARMASHTSAERICWVTMAQGNPLVREHIRAGGMAAALEGGVNGQMVTLYDNGMHIPLLWTHLIPATLEGQALHNVQNAMFAAACAHAMGVKLDAIRQGLRTFDATFFQAPGRMNVFDNHGFKVILDYGHNEAAVHAMCTLVDNLTAGNPQRGKRAVVLAAPGDRRDEDIRALAARAAKSFDRFFVRPDDDRRGRGEDEVPRILFDALTAAGVSASAIHRFTSEADAVDAALASCKPGDLLLVFGDDYTRCWKQIIYFGGRAPELQPAPAAPAASPVDEPVEEPLPANYARDSRGVFPEEAAD
jgi:cyanophycin synthetase